MRNELLGEETLYQQGCFRKVRRYWKGWCPEKGEQIDGWTGPETVEDVTIVEPIRKYMVLEEK